MAEVPQEALQAAADAHERWYLDHGGDPDRCYRESHEKWSRATLEAAAPLLAAQVRREIVEEVRALADPLRVKTRAFVERHPKVQHGPSVAAVLWAVADEIENPPARQIGEADAR